VPGFLSNPVVSKHWNQAQTESCGCPVARKFDGSPLVNKYEGATDDVGYRAVEKPHYFRDLQSTILRQLGLDYKKLDFVLNGRPFHLVEEGLEPIEAILR
jgi:hypothetical protein